MSVIPALLHQLQQRAIKMMEAELRTQALLLGEEYYEATPALTKLIRSVKPVSVRRSARLDSWEDALRYSLLYGTSMPSVNLQQLRPVQDTLSGKSPDVVCFDDIEKLTEQLMANAMTSGRFHNKTYNMFTGIHDAIEFVPVEQATLPRASMVWPTSHQGKKGPAPHKPFRKK